jgi:hypothetical protein
MVGRVHSSAGFGNPKVTATAQRETLHQLVSTRRSSKAVLLSIVCNRNLVQACDE